MSDTPWLGDACSLVEAFRSGERSPAEELEAVLGAVSHSELGAMPFLPVEAARSAAAAGGRLPALRRRADRDQGAGDGGGLAGHGGQPGAGRPGGRPHQHHGPAAGGGRGGQGGPDHGQRVRRAQRERHPAAWRHPQPLGPGAHRRRVVRRLGRGGGRRPRAHRHRRRRRRVDPHPGGVLRPGGDEGHGGAHPPRPPHRGGAAHGGAGLPGPLGPGRGPLVRRVRGLRRP